MRENGVAIRREQKDCVERLLEQVIVLWKLKMAGAVLYERASRLCLSRGTASPNSLHSIRYTGRLLIASESTKVRRRGKVDEWLPPMY